MGSFLNPPQPTRHAALDHLRRISGKLGRQYAKTRNFDFGAGRHKSVTTLSPWIRHRLLLEEEAVSAALSTHGFVHAEKFIQEVFWRTYWKGWLEMRPQVWRDFKAARDQAWETWQNDEGYRRAIAGETEIECFNAWSRELQHTNYLHNHARMWFASIWIFTLQLPWSLGADFFLQHLLDGDAASNTLSWRWVGGMQTLGKTYLARAENISKYTAGRLNPTGMLAMDTPPIDTPLPPQPLPLDFTSTPNSRTPSLLIVTDDDLGQDTFDFPTADIVGIVSVNTAKSRSPHGISEGVAEFVGSAMNNAVKGFANRHGLPVYAISSKDRNGLHQLAAKLGARQISGLRNPVGPARDVIADLTQEIDAHHLTHKEWTRPWDQTSWPYAAKGFFKFKNAIPSILAARKLV